VNEKQSITHRHSLTRLVPNKLIAIAPTMPSLIVRFRRAHRRFDRLCLGFDGRVFSLSLFRPAANRGARSARGATLARSRVPATRIRFSIRWSILSIYRLAGCITLARISLAAPLRARIASDAANLTGRRGTVASIGSRHDREKAPPAFTLDHYQSRARARARLGEWVYYHVERR